MEPLYNVYPLTIYHFRDRFADQPWIIYDARRRYGYYYDLKEVNEITFEDSRAAFLRHGKLEDELLDKNEKLFQEGWKSYFHSVCIQSRLNPVKHKKDMPVRFWKYLTEKD
jgi:probable DNA metabolism protein